MTQASTSTPDSSTLEASLQHEESSEQEDYDVSTKGLCSDCRYVSNGLIAAIDKKDKAISKVIATLAQVVAEEGLNRERYARLCQVRQLTSGRLDERIRMFWQQRHAISKLKTDKETWMWFRATDRPPRATDNMGHFNYMHMDWDYSCIDYEAIRLWLNVQNDGNWEADGSVIIGGMFEWMFEEGSAEEPSISRLLQDEFDMYQHHLRQRGGHSNYGWLRNMYHGIFQQVVDNLRLIILLMLHSDKIIITA